MFLARGCVLDMRNELLVHCQLLFNFTANED